VRPASVVVDDDVSKVRLKRLPGVPRTHLASLWFRVPVASPRWLPGSGVPSLEASQRTSRGKGRAGTSARDREDGRVIRLLSSAGEDDRPISTRT
jgi:hypothetical protein